VDDDRRAGERAPIPPLAGEGVPIRPSFHLEVPSPPIPVAVAGTPRLIYELHLLNFAGEPLSLERVAVLNAADGGVLADLEGEALVLRLGGPDARQSEQVSPTLAPGTFRVLYLEIELDGDVPTALQHRVTYRGSEEGPGDTATVRAAPTPVRSEPPVVLSPPVRGGPWVAVYHPSWQRGHRRVVYAVAGRARIPGRFAVDWFKVDAMGRRAAPPEDEVANWYGHGAEVLAVAAGVVAAVRTDMPESATLSGYVPPALADATGNYVALDIGGGRYAIYEHLEPGSIRVRAGDRVEPGQVIASVGFTGSTSGPHLHFHVAGANAPLDAEGLPFVLDRFEVVGAYGPSDLFTGEEWRSPADGGGGWRTEELPAPNAVVQLEPPGG
jgi:murein DD-endopeptidase MepM/ murein hydrolase activator NlpD